MLNFNAALAPELWSILKTIPRRLSRGHYFREASALSFSTILALVPAMAVVFSALSLFPIFKVWSVAIQEFVYRNFVPQFGEQVRQYLQEFSANTGHLTIWGLIFLLFTALALLSTIEDAFNDIWHVEKGRSIGHRVLVYWAMLTLGPILIVLSLSLSSYMWSLTNFTDQDVVRSLKVTILTYLPFLLELSAFMLFYFGVPNCEVRIRHALIGGLVAAILFELAKYGFGLYLSQVRSYELIYGALAVLPVFLIWIYLSWLVVLIGAYVTAALGEMENGPSQDASPS